MERRLGGLLGLLIGDALGVPYEFHGPDEIPKVPEMTPPPGFRRSHVGVPPGTWSDDGAHALCLLDSLITCGRLDLDDLGRRLSNWYHHGYLAVDGVFDVGITTRSAIDAMARGVPAADAGPRGESDNGNGSLMRVLPLALWHAGDDAALIADAARQSLVTHGHPRSQACCAVYALWARGVLEDRPDPYEAALDVVARTFGEEVAVIRAFRSPRGTGYVVDALVSARVAQDAGDYAAVVRRAIRFGNDTDTTACIAGGIAGIRDGLRGIPAPWREALRGKAALRALVARWLGPFAVALLPE